MQECQYILPPRDRERTPRNLHFEKIMSMLAVIESEACGLIDRSGPGTGVGVDSLPRVKLKL